MKFEVLYHFSHGMLHLVETKRLDLPASAGPSEVYRWSLIDDDKVRALTFNSMSLNPQRRIFSEGMIEFDLLSCRGKILERELELTRQEKMSDRMKKLLEETL